MKEKSRGHSPRTNTPKKNSISKNTLEQKSSPRKGSVDGDVIRRLSPAGIKAALGNNSQDRNHPLKFVLARDGNEANERSEWLAAPTSSKKEDAVFRTFSPSKRILSDDKIITQ